MKTIVFFNNKEGIGKTTLVYHISYMLAELGHKILSVDLDPQAHLTSLFLSADKFEDIYGNESNRTTIIDAIKPLDTGLGDIAPATVHQITSNIGLIAGDLDLSLFEDKLTTGWEQCMNHDETAFRIISSFHRIINQAGTSFGSDINLVVVGPNFGAINRAALIAADYFIVPMATDLLSLQGLKNLGSRLNSWKSEWVDRSSRNPEQDLQLPNGTITPLGYVVMQHGRKDSRPVKSYLNWANRIPHIFRSSVLRQEVPASLTVENDEFCLAQLKHYHSLIPMAMETRKPIFLLKPADGAIGAHLGAVKSAYEDFRTLSQKIVDLL